MKKGLLSLSVVTELSTSVFAAGMDDIRISGFVNVVAGVNDVNDDDYEVGVNSNKQSKSYRGYDDTYDFQNESLAAIQFSANITDNMGATIQLIAQKDEAGDDIRMEWGYVYFDATDELRFLAGRIRPSLFLYSDYLDVGYAYNWVTPPSEVYDQVNISNLDGVSASYNLEVGDNTITTTIYAGNSSDDKVNPMYEREITADSSLLDLDFDNIIGGEISISNDYAKLRAGYIQAKATENTYKNALPDELKQDKSGAQFYGVGLNIDYEDIIFASEYIVREMDETAAPDISAYYGMIGYKIGDFTPSYTYAVADSDYEKSSSSIPGVYAQVNTIRALNLDDRKSHTIGIRYDVNAKAAVKLEYNRAEVTHSTYNGMTDSISEEDETINTYRVALNVVF